VETFFNIGYIVFNNKVLSKDVIYHDDISKLMDITVNQMMKIEENGHALGMYKRLMMENAGAAIARFLVHHFDEIKLKRILVFVGLGNNGGDALVAARHLISYGANVHIVFLGDPKMIKTPESRENFNLTINMKSIKLFYNCNDLDSDFNYDILIDGILGTGVNGMIKQPYLHAIECINKYNSFVVSVDIPTGINPDTGNSSNVYVKADVTITFHLMKIGMKKTNKCGTIYVEKIGIPPDAEYGVL